ncbi:MAG: ABC transporter substrate-binding protein [Pseudomonadales bacterium]
MGKRFSARDLLLILFLGAILVSVWLAMVQIDRQWVFIRETQQKLDGQTRDIAEIRRQLRDGVAVAGRSAQDAAATDPGSGFYRAALAEARDDYARGDWLVNAFPSSPQRLTPTISTDTYASRVQEQVLDTLLTRDPESLEWLPLLAASWSVSEDGLSYRFRIRPGARFSDGEPLTAADVAFTYRFIMDERIATPRFRAYYGRIAEVTANGDEVVFRLDEPYYGALEIAGLLPIMAEHFYGRYLQSAEAAEEFNNATGLLFGSGPYKLADPVNWTPGQAVELIRNERYWGRVQPSFDRVIWKIISNDAANLTEFKNGDIDTYNARPLNYRNLLADEALMSRVRHFEYQDARGGYTFIAWNQRRDGKPTWFADRRVREAMTYLTDRQRVVDEVFLGYAETANGPFNPLGPQNNVALATRGYDPDRARALLAEAGFEDRDGDGVIESADGEPFRISLTYPSASDDYKRLVLLLKDLYVTAGVILEPEPTDWPLLLKAIDDKTFDAISLGWSSDFEVDLFQFFHSSQNGPGGDNFVSYDNPELDAVIEAARVQLDENARMALWRSAHEMIWQDQPYTFLLRASRLDFIDARIANVERVRAGLNRPGLWRMPTEWYVPVALQRH